MALSDTAQVGICVAIAAVLQTASSAVAFSGTFVDDNALQAKFIEKKRVDEAQAAKLVSDRRKVQRVVLIVALVASLVFDGLAIWVLLAS